MHRSALLSRAVLLTLISSFFGASCSSDSTDGGETSSGGSGIADNTGGGENTGSSPGSGSGDGSGGAPDMGGLGGLGGEGEGEGGTPSGGQGSGGPPDAPDCTDHPLIQSGRNYGNTTTPYDYSVFAVRLSEDVPEGTYSIRVNDDSAGEAFLYLDDSLVDSFDYDPEALLADATSQSVAFPGYFELDIRSQTVEDLSALSASLFDGCHQVIVQNATVVEEGGEYGPYVIETLVVDDNAEAGTYTFFAESGNAGSVTVLKDEEEFLTLMYAWMTTVGGGESFTFVFDGLAEITITRTTGTSNLFGLADTLLDGRHELLIE